MFKLNQKHKINRTILKCDYIRYSLSEISQIKTDNSQSYINIPRQDSVNTVLGIYLECNFDVLNAATGNRYAVGDTFWLLNLGPLGLFSTYKLKTSSDIVLEEVSYAHIACLMCTLITSNRNSDDLSIGFDRSRDRRKQELTNNKNQKGKFHVTI